MLFINLAKHVLQPLQLFPESIDLRHIQVLPLQLCTTLQYLDCEFNALVGMWHESLPARITSAALVPTN
ncbi:MAG TPA: hypothetical protein VLT36_07850 [Candidatus Dormibacteraeota bacterium]|nr:hypothetical protein [Candidatus Dormibacteraeota bacterium]